MTDTILDDLFLGCAFTAFLEQAHAQQGWPDPEATRLRAYKIYEEALAEDRTKLCTDFDIAAETR